MIVSDIFEMTVHPVFDRGVPNLERIAIQVNLPLNIGQFGIMVGVRADGGSAYPLKDQLFWFGDGYLNAGDWIFVYTGTGEPRVSNLPDSESKIYATHWGKKTTLFHTPELVPILIRVDAVFVPQESKTLLQGKK